MPSYGRLWNNIPATTTGQLVTSTQLNTLIASLNYVGNPPAARVYNTAAQSVTSNTLFSPTAVTFGAIEFDSASMWSGADPTALVITDGGRYSVNANVTLNAPTSGPTGIGSGDRWLAIQYAPSGGGWVNYAEVHGPNHTAGVSLAASTLVPADAGGRIRVVVAQNSGYTWTVNVNAFIPTLSDAKLAAHRIGG